MPVLKVVVLPGGSLISIALNQSFGCSVCNYTTISTFLLFVLSMKGFLTKDVDGRTLLPMLLLFELNVLFVV